MKREDLAVLSAIEIAYVAMAVRFWFLCDDAFITFRYSRNWAHGHGIRYNLIEDPPVEGYSNFLWMVLAAGVEYLGADVRVWVPLCSLLLGVFFVGYLFLTLRDKLEVSTPVAAVSTMAFALSPCVAVWSTSGLATLPMALACFALFERLCFGEGRSGLLGAVVAGISLTLIRTEGIAWLGVVAVIGAGFRMSDPLLENGRERVAQGWRHVGRALCLILAVFALYYLCRTWYFGEWVSNTAKVKAHFSHSSAARGGMYAALFYLTYLAPAVYLALGALAVGFRPRLGFAAALLGLAFPVYAVVIGGDYMTSGRLFVPGIAFSAVGVAITLQGLVERWHLVRVPGVLALATLVIVGLLPSHNVHLVPKDVRKDYHVRQNVSRFLSEAEHWQKMKENAQKWRLTGLALKQVAKPTDKITLAAIGAHGYYSEIHILDRNGLVNKKVAARPMRDARVWRKSPGHDKSVRPTWFFNQKPEFLGMELVHGRRASLKMRSRVIEWERMPWWPKARRFYVAEWKEVELPELNGVHYLLYLRRVRDDESVHEAWAAFDRSLAQLGT